MNMHNVVLFHQTRGHRRSQTSPNSPVNSADGSILPTNLGGQNGSVPWCVLKGEAVTDLVVCVFIYQNKDLPRKSVHYMIPGFKSISSHSVSATTVSIHEV